MFGKDSLSCKNYKEKSPAGDRAPSKVNENSQHYSTMIQEKYQPTKEQVREGLLSLIDNALSFMCSLQDWVAKDNVWFNDILILREAIRVLDEQEERSK
jgi:regulator of sirC expression with transglutaminase-like and TPR domain